jgi:ABC-type phosphate transport system substrate-binding protein
VADPIQDGPVYDEEPRPTGLKSAIDQLLRRRALLYIVAIAALAAWKLWPTMQGEIKKVQNVQKASEGAIVISGSDNAANLVMESIAQFKSDYPKIEMSMNGGGTISALEDLLNRRADVAILSRPPLPREIEIATGHGDSLLFFPVALGGISLLAHRQSAIASVSVDHLRQAVEAGMGQLPVAGRSFRVYGPDPNGGLWNALLERLEVGTSLQPAYAPVAEGADVLTAIRNDPESIGFASDLTFELAADDPDLVAVPIVVEAGSSFAPTKANIMSGSYPLFHYVYMCTTARRGPLAAGFVTYFSQSTGQKWVARRGFLPARLPVREIRLTGGTSS